MRSKKLGNVDARLKKVLSTFEKTNERNKKMLGLLGMEHDEALKQEIAVIDALKQKASELAERLSVDKSKHVNAAEDSKK